MATPQQISTLRTMINEPKETSAYTDEELGRIIDYNEGNLSLSAGEIWRAKAGKVAHLVNISEGGSSRSNSDIYTHFLAMAEQYDPSDSESSTTRRTIISTAERA